MKAKIFRHITICLPFFWATEVVGACKTDQEIPPSTPDSQFIDHGNGTLTDIKTGLIWAKCTEGQSGSDCSTGSASAYTWEEALNQSEKSTLANYTDWRLPHIRELRSIVEEQCFAPSINTNLFPNTPVSGFWSTSPYVGDPNFAWYSYFYMGSSDGNNRNKSWHVRMVRGGR